MSSFRRAAEFTDYSPHIKTIAASGPQQNYNAKQLYLKNGWLLHKRKIAPRPDRFSDKPHQLPVCNVVTAATSTLTKAVKFRRT